MPQGAFAIGAREVEMNKRTKVVCTLGPATDSESTLKGLIAAGMDVARLDMTKAGIEEQTARVQRLQKVRREMDAPCAVMVDTRGPEIRTGGLAGAEPVKLMAGRHFTLTEREVEGDDRQVAISCPGLYEVVEPGTIILLDDGMIELAVDEVAGTDIECTVQNTGMLGERVTVNLPDVTAPLPTITQQDKEALLFAIEHDADFVVASFVHNASEVREVYDFLDENGGHGIQVISKIECNEAVRNIEEIIDASFGIMIARVDLGIEVPAHSVPHIQKKIIRACNDAAKVAITSTQMLDSMARSPLPTRAEVGDLANAVCDGTDAIVLGDEVAFGRYPVQALRMAVQTIESSEPFVLEDVSVYRAKEHSQAAQAVSQAAVACAEAINASCIVAPTLSGRTARLASALRPLVPIYSVTATERTMRQQQLFWGVTPIMADVMNDVQQVIFNAQRAVLEHGLVDQGDIAVFTAGDRRTTPQVTMDAPGVKGEIAATNVMQVVQIRSDAEQGGEL